MGIEIRPSAVTGQIGGKAGMLSVAQASLQEKKAAAGEIAGDGELCGGGFDSAKAKIGNYPVLLAAIEHAITLTMDADNKVSGALGGYFGGESQVSEQEQHDKMMAALEGAQRCQDKAAEAGRHKGPFQGIVQAAFGAQERVYQAQADLARDVLQKIYSYCSETNGVHNGVVVALDVEIGKGIGAMSAAGYDTDTKSWKQADVSWVEGVRNAVASGVTKMGDLYREEKGEAVLNEERCRALLRKPIELWLIEEYEATDETFTALGKKALEKGGKTTALDRFISCGYKESTESHEVWKRQPDNSKVYANSTTTTFTMEQGLASFLSAYLTKREAACVYTKQAQDVPFVERSLACVASGLLSSAASYQVSNPWTHSTEAFPPDMSLNLRSEVSAGDETMSYGEASFGGSGFFFVAREDATAIGSTVEMRDLFDARGYKNPLTDAADSVLENAVSAGIDFVLKAVPGVSTAKTGAGLAVDAVGAIGEALESNRNTLARIELGKSTLEAEDRWIQKGSVVALPDGSARIVMPSWTRPGMDAYTKASERYIFEVSEGYEGSYHEWLDTCSEYYEFGDEGIGDLLKREQIENREIAETENCQWVDRA